MISYSAHKSNFREFWVKMTLKVKINDLNFQYQLRASHHACLVQIWLFQLKFVTIYRADKVKLRTDRRTDGRTNGQTQATTIPLRPERPRGKTSMVPGLESWQSIQTACNLHDLQGSGLEDSVRHQVHAGLQEIVSVCSVNIPKMSLVVYYLLVFITAAAGNLNASNGR